MDRETEKEGETKREREREREMFYLTTHSTHFIYGYMASDIWLRTIPIVRKETRCRHIGYSYRLTARVLLYAPSHRQDNTYHSLCYTSCGALVGTRNREMKTGRGRDVETDRWTERQREKERQIEMKTERKREKERQIEMKTERKREKEMETERESGGQRDTTPSTPGNTLKSHALIHRFSSHSHHEDTGNRRQNQKSAKQNILISFDVITSKTIHFEKSIFTHRNTYTLEEEKS